MLKHNFLTYIVIIVGGVDRVKRMKAMELNLGLQTQAVIMLYKPWQDAYFSEYNATHLWQAVGGMHLANHLYQLAMPQRRYNTSAQHSLPWPLLKYLLKARPGSHTHFEEVSHI